MLLHHATGFLQLIEPERHARGHVAVGARHSAYGQVRIRLAGQVAAQVAGLPARPTGETREPQACRQLRAPLCPRR